jgi:hypothetical protein
VGFGYLFVLCCYEVLKHLRLPRKVFDGTSTRASRIALLLSVTLIPFLVIQGLNLLGWSLRFVSVIQTVMVILIAVSAGAGIITLLSALWKRKKQPASSAVALPPSTPTGDCPSVQAPPGKLPGEERRFCPHCRTAAFAMDDIRSCHNCGASLGGVTAKGAGSFDEGGES